MTIVYITCSWDQIPCGIRWDSEERVNPWTVLSWADYPAVGQAGMGAMYRRTATAPSTKAKAAPAGTVYARRADVEPLQWASLARRPGQGIVLHPSKFEAESFARMWIGPPNVLQVLPGVAGKPTVYLAPLGDRLTPEQAFRYFVHGPG